MCIRDSIVPAHDRGDLADADLLELLGKLVHKILARGGRHVAAIQEAVDIDLFKAHLLGHFNEGEQVGIVAVDAAVGKQAHQVEGAPLFLAVFHGRHKFRVLEEVTVLDGLGDPGQLLVDNAAGANIGMAYLRVAHLAIGQSHIHARGADEGVGIGRQDLIQIGGIGSLNRVAILIGVITETIHNQECYGFFHRKTSYTIHLERKRPPIRTAFYCCAIKINHTVHAAGRAHKALRAPNHMNQTGYRRGMSRFCVNRNVIACNAGGKLPQTSRAVASSVTKTRAPRQCFANKTRGAICPPLGARETRQCHQQNSRRVILPREGPPATAGGCRTFVPIAT